MNNKHKTKAQLIAELQELRGQVAQVEEALNESEQRYRKIIETAQEAIWVVDAEANTTYVNQHLAEMLGYASDELIGRSVFDFVDDADRRETRKYLERGKSGIKEQHDFRFRRKDGSEVWTMVSTTPLFDLTGQFVGGLAMLIDITERRRSEEAFRKSEERWRTYIEQANDLIFILDRSGWMISVNKATCETTGYTVEEMVGKSPIEFVVSEHQAVADAAMRNRLAGLPLKQIELDILSKDGRRVSLEVRGRTLYDGDDLIGAFEIARDITERKRAEQALKESEARLQAAIENLPFELWVRDVDGRCTVQNPYAVLQWGNQIGKHLEETAYDPEILALWESNNRRALAGEVVKGEFEIAQGEQAGYYYSVAAPIRVDTEVRGVLAVNIDITDRKRAEEALRESEAKFRVLAETVAAAIYIYQGSKMVYVNPTTEVHTGYKPEELLRVPFWQVVHPEFRDLVKERGLARQRGESVPERYEFKIVTKSGETRWLDAAAAQLVYEGKPAAIGTALDITERKRAEEALLETQQRLQHLLFYSPAIIYSLRVEGESFTAEWMSESVRRLTGYEASEAQCEGWWLDHIHPDDRAQVTVAMPRLFTDNRLVLEYRFQHKDGGYLWLHDEMALLRDRSGKPIEAIGSWVDVTERREAEAALRDSEERFRTLVGSMNDVVFTLDRRQRHSGVFGRWAERFGLQPELLIGKTAREILGAEAARVHEEANARALLGEQVVYEWSLTNEQGTFYFQTSLSPIRDRSGKVSGLVGVGRDITLHKQAEQALRESRSHLQAILDNCPAMIFLKDSDGRYLQVNRQFEVTFNLIPEQVLGRTDAEVFKPELAAAFRATDRKVLEAGHSLEFEEQAVYADGPHTYIVHKFPLQDATGNVYAVGGISTDISARKCAEEELRKQKELLQRIIDHIPVMIRLRGDDGRIKLVNKEWERTMGWTLEELQRRDLDILAEAYPDPHYRQYVLDFIGAATGKWADFKTRVRDGRVIDTTWTSFRLSDGTHIGFGQDITERKRSEEALRDSQERFRRYFELGLIGMAITSPTGEYIEVNDRLCSILRYERSELLQMSWADLTHPDDLAANIANYNRVQAGESDGYSMDKRFIRKDGKVIHATISVKCLRRADGSVDYFVAMLQDITDRKQADELLQRQTAQLAALHEIGFEISVESELSRVLDIVTRRAAELLNASGGSVYIRDRERFELKLVASLDSELIGLRLKEGEGLTGRVAVSGDAQAIGDYSKWKERVSIFDGKGFGPVLSAPLKWQQTVIGAITLARRQGEPRFTDDDIQFLEQIAAEAAIAIHQATLFEDVQESHKRLQVLSHRLIDTQEAERKRLARELHDQIGQALTAVQISLHAVQSSHDGGSAGLLEDSLAVIDEAIQQVHDLSLDLRPSLLDDLGLVAALRWYVDRVAGRAGLVRCFNADGLETRLAPEVETACFRIAQEALTNVQRHAHAATVWVQVSNRDSGLQLSVRDDGVGFDVRTAMSRTGLSASLGLQGMQERAAAIGGLVNIESTQGSGTKVQATFLRGPTLSN